MKKILEIDNCFDCSYRVFHRKVGNVCTHDNMMEKPPEDRVIYVGKIRYNCPLRDALYIKELEDTVDQLQETIRIISETTCPSKLSDEDRQSLDEAFDMMPMKHTLLEGE